MAIDFPASPVSGDTYSFGGRTWRFNGTGWERLGTAATASDTDPGVIEIAVQSEMEAASDVLRAVVPGRLQYHPGVCKAWVKYSTSGGTVSRDASYNVSSITDNGVGDFTHNFTAAFSSTQYLALGNHDATLGATINGARALNIHTLSTGSARVLHDNTGGAAEDPAYAIFMFFGDQ